MIIAFRILTALVALTLTLFGGQLLFGAWLSTEHAIHELGWGVAEGLLIVVALVVSLRRPADHPVAMQQVLAATAALLATMALTAAVDGFTVVLAALVGVLLALHPARGDVLRLDRPDRRLMLVAAAGAVPLVLYALEQAALQRTVTDAHSALDHYTGTALAALALVLVAGLAAFSAGRSRLPAITAGLGVLLLGVASIVFPDQASGFGPLGAAAAVAWGAVFIGLAEATRRSNSAWAEPLTARNPV